MLPRGMPDATHDSSPKASRGARRWILRLLLVPGTLLVLLLAAEIGLRFAGYGPETHLRWFSHPQLHYTAAPNQDGEVQVSDPKAGEKTIRIHINGYGQRCEDYPLEKQPGELRIVALGDSLTFGPGVGNDEMFLGQLQQAFRDHPPHDGFVRVVNTAANGYSTIHYLRWMESQLQTYSPDLVLLCLYIGNDMCIATRHTLFNPVPFPEWGRNTALGHFLLENYRPTLTRLRQRWSDDVNSPLEEIEPRLRRYIDVPEDQLGYDDKMALWRHALGHIERMQQIAEQASVPMVCLLIPQSHMLVGDTDFPLYSWLQRSIEALGMPVLNPIEALRPLGLQGWHSYDPGHLNAAGHAALGAFLSEELRKLSYGD